MNPYYKAKFFVSAGDADPEQHISYPKLTAAIIDVATYHANELGIGNRVLEPNNMGWVLSRLNIELTNPPAVNAFYEIETWIESYNRHFSTRCFKITNENGEPAGCAKSVWFVLNTITRESVNLTDIKVVDSLIAGESVPVSQNKLHFAIVEEKKQEPVSNNNLIASHPALFHKFKYSDLDAYRHVNTISYIRLLNDMFSLKEHDEMIIKGLELSFKKEAKYGMSAKLLRTDINENQTLLQLTDEEDGSVLLLAQLSYEHK